MFCSFVLQATGIVSYSGGNHLSASKRVLLALLSVHFLREGAPTMIWVAHSRGLPRSTFAISRKASSLWHFQGNHTISQIRDLGTFPAVSLANAKLPWLMVSPGTNTTGISAPCEHGLSSAAL
jgi:hypothetical protein